MKIFRLYLLALACCAALGSVFAVQPAISAGDSHSLFLKTDGSVWASGYNGIGQLGDGTTGSVSTPILTMTGVAAISAGAYHSLFLKTDGSVWASGANGSGQLGDGTTGSVSTPILTMTGVAAISAGGGHSLFLKTDGSVWASGSNYYGGLGDGTTTDRSTPIQVMTGVAAISAGGGHSLFLKTDGSVWASGYNGSGQLGDGTTSYRSTPIQVMTGVAAISADSYHSLFLKTDGSVWASGANYYGQLGDGTTGSVSTPIQTMTGVAAISAGGGHSLFLKTDGSVWASGYNAYGQLGDGTTSYSRITPIQIMTGVAAVSAGDSHSLFRKTDGTVWASGANRYGQLGDGTTTANRSTPQQATILLTTAPELTAQPTASLFALPTQTVSLAVTAAGSPTFIYQWQKDGVDVLGATRAVITLADIKTTDSGSYRCVVTNSDGSVTSNAGVLTVYAGNNLTIRTQPTPQVIVVGNSATLSLTVTSIEPIGYQWRRNGVSIQGANASSYTIPSVIPTDAGTYSCIISDYDEVDLSSGAILTVQVPPVIITTQPSSLSVNPAASATFSVTATGTGTLIYQWRKNGRDIGGATASALTLTDVRFIDEAKYTCFVSNAYRSALSNAATLTISISSTSPDSDGDGVSDALETYLSVFGFDPAVDSTEERVRLLAMIPDLGFYYTADQMRNLAVGSPTLKRAANGNFLLDVTVQESTNLNTWTKRTLSAPMMTAPNGIMRLELPPLNSSTQFYRLQSQPTP